jgi:hypothetical protein
VSLIGQALSRGECCEPSVLWAEQQQQHRSQEQQQHPPGDHAALHKPPPGTVPQLAHRLYFDPQQQMYPSQPLVATLTFTPGADSLPPPTHPIPPLSPSLPLQAHNTCVTEHEKYALGATKPGGFAEQGFHGDGQAHRPAAAASADSEAVGLEFLSERPPWRCACCNVNCTSRPTLLVHAAGAKHKRRVSELIPAL